MSERATSSSLREVALAAYAERQTFDRAKREAKAAQLQQEAAEKRAFEERLARGRRGFADLAEWFPGAEWEYLDTWGDWVVFGTEGIQLMISRDREDESRSYIEFVTHHEPGARTGRWRGTTVYSPADIGREIESRERADQAQEVCADE